MYEKLFKLQQKIFIEITAIFSFDCLEFFDFTANLLQENQKIAVIL